MKDSAGCIAEPITGLAQAVDTVAELRESMECPLCLGEGELSRTEVLERLGMKDFARVAQLSAEEAIRLLTARERLGEEARWAKFDTELSKRLAEIVSKHNAELQKLQAEKSDLVARLKGIEEGTSATLENAREQGRLTAAKELHERLVAVNGKLAELEAAQKLAEEQRAAELAKARAELEAALSSEKTKANDLGRQAHDYLREIDELRDRNEKLEAEMAKVARVGRKEEVDFAEEVRSWPGFWLGPKLARHGDYLMAFSDAAGNALDPVFLVENKDKTCLAAADIRKVVADTKERKLRVAVLVMREESQLRHVDRQSRWAQEDEIWLLRSTRAWLPRDLEVLRPVFERMRVEGPDFLQKNAALAAEVQRSLADMDEIEGQLQKAGTAIEKAQTLTTKYRARLTGLCDGTASAAVGPCRSVRKTRKASAGNGNGTQERLLRDGGAMLGLS
jgi:hypothetical protein